MIVQTAQYKFKDIKLIKIRFFPLSTTSSTDMSVINSVASGFFETRLWEYCFKSGGNNKKNTKAIVDAFEVPKKQLTKLIDYKNSRNHSCRQENWMVFLAMQIKINLINKSLQGT